MMGYIYCAYVHFVHVCKLKIKHSCMCDFQIDVYPILSNSLIRLNVQLSHMIHITIIDSHPILIQFTRFSYGQFQLQIGRILIGK